MEKYGTVFDKNFNLKKDRFRNLIVQYYQNPTLQKVKNTGTQSVYMAKVDNNLLTESQYIVATCNRDNESIGIMISLENLYWNSFQTRYLKNANAIPFTYTIPKDKKFNILLELVERQEKISKYRVQNHKSVFISLLHSNQNLYEYPSTGTLLTALETFKTIITFN